MSETTRLTVLYDERCVVCRRARNWLLSEPTHVRVELLAAGSPAARSRFGAIPWRGAELVVVADTGEVWVGPAAFLTAMWATIRWRPWSYRMSGPALAPLAERFFKLISHHRKRVGALLAEEPECTWCERPTHPARQRLDETLAEHS